MSYRPDTSRPKPCPRMNADGTCDACRGSRGCICPTEFEMVRIDAPPTSKTTTASASGLLQAAKDFYNATVADSEVRINSVSSEKRDIAAAAAERLRSAILAVPAVPGAVEEIEMLLAQYHQEVWDTAQSDKPDYDYAGRDTAKQLVKAIKSLAQGGA